MSLVNSDEMLRAAGLSEQEARLEIACHWFDDGKLTIGRAADLAGVTESAFESELAARGIPRYRYTEEMLEQDVETLKRIGRW